MDLILVRVPDPQVHTMHDAKGVKEMPPLGLPPPLGERGGHAPEVDPEYT